MTRLARALAHAIRLLDASKQRAALVGGLAVSVRVEPRFTRDVDLAVSVKTDREAEQVVLVFQRAGYQLRALVEQQATHRLATARLECPTRTERGVLIDLLFASTGIERELVRSATRLEAMTGVEVPVARIGHLIAMKVLARDDRRRPNDRADLLALIQAASSAELRRATAALTLIEARGFHRNRKLLSLLDSARAEAKALQEM